MIWMFCIGLIVLTILLCIFRRHIYLYMFGMKSAMNDMSLLWIENGANINTLNKVLSNTTALDGKGKNSWVSQFSQIARKFYKKQILIQLDTEKKKENKLLMEIYFQSALYFGIAKYPHFFEKNGHNHSKMESYKLQKLCFEKAMNMMDFCIFKVIKTPNFGRNKEWITSYLFETKKRNKKQKDKAFIIIIGSIDIWKCDLWFLIKYFVENNISVLCIDLAGTGDIEYKLDLNSLYIYRDTIKWLKQQQIYRKRLNFKNLGIFGVGFGGYFGVKLAQYQTNTNDGDDEGIKFIINLSSPLIYTFNKEWILSRMNNDLVNALYFALGLIYEVNRNNLWWDLNKWKLNDYDDESLGNIKILSIMGGNDKFINPLDAQIFGNEENRFYFKDDGYLCTKNIKKWLPNTLDWIENNTDCN